MGLTVDERADIAAAPDGAARLLQIDRMAEANLDDRFLAVNALDENGDPLDPAEKAKLRRKTIRRWSRTNFNPDKIRADINVIGFSGNSPVVSADNDYTAQEQGHIQAYVSGLAKHFTGPDRIKDSYDALNRYGQWESILATLFPGISAGDQRTFIRLLYRT